MYLFLRNVHGLLALFLSLLIAMYAITGLVIFRPYLLPDDQVVTKRESTVDWEPPQFEMNAQAAMAALESRAEVIRKGLDISGRFESVRTESDGGYTLIYRKPGVEERVVVYPRNDRIGVETVRGGTSGTLIHLHKMDGFEGGGLYFLWGVLVDVVGVSLIVFAVSGIGLWHTAKVTRRGLGWGLLFASMSYTLGSIVVLLI